MAALLSAVQMGTESEQEEITTSLLAQVTGNEGEGLDPLARELFQRSIYGDDPTTSRVSGETIPENNISATGNISKSNISLGLADGKYRLGKIKDASTGYPSSQDVFDEDNNIIGSVVL